MKTLILALTIFVSLFVVIEGQFFPNGPPPLDPWGNPMPFWRRRRPCNFFNPWEVITRRRCFNELRRMGIILSQSAQEEFPFDPSQSEQWPQNNIGWTKTPPPRQQTTKLPTTGKRPSNNFDPLNILGLPQNNIQTTTRPPIITTTRQLPITAAKRPSNNFDPLNILGLPQNNIQTTTRRLIITTTRQLPITTTFRAIITTTRQIFTTRPPFKPVAGPNGKIDPNSDSFIPPPPML